MSHKIIFFGTEDFSAVALQGLIDNNFSIAAVVTKPDSRKGRGQKLLPPAVKLIATQYNIPVWQPSSLHDITDDIRALQPVSGVLVSYGKLIPESIIELFTPGIINLHPSLLPTYRGPSPIESAILNGDPVTGVSIMQLVKAMDAGPIYSQKEVPLIGNETRRALYVSLASLGTSELIRLLPHILDGSLQPVAQDETQATYCQLLSKEHSLLRPETSSAVEAERQVRAYQDFPKTKIRFGDHELIVTKAHVTAQPEHALSIRFRDGNFLTVDELVAPSGRTMNAAAYLNGYAA